MLRLFTIIIFLFLSIRLYSVEIYDAHIDIKDNYSKYEISPNIYGGFLEFDLDFMNGTLGMSAQELTNRGFDNESYETNLSSKWYNYFEGIPPSFKLISDDKYNENGVYSQKIINSKDDNLAGIRQVTYLSDDEHEFYIYMKSKEELNIYIRFSDIDDNSNVLYEQYIGTPDTEWKKYSIDIPADLNIYSANIIIYFKEKGELLLDEASLMPKNHFHNIRKEYLDLYKKWKPNILRFPGGTFADEHAAHWHYGIGEIDKRKSPNLFDGRQQRFEIGTDEFIAFCNEIGAIPQLVNNMKLGSPEESAGWVEYCNGDTNTKYGKMRADNGYPAPFNVKYWEIGNEQWNDVVDRTEKFKAHAIEMFKVDDSIELIMDGNLWGYFDYYKKTVDIAGDYFDIYGWHYLHFVDEELLGDTLTYEAVMAGYQGNRTYLDFFRDWRNKTNRYDMDLAVTELWVAYFHKDWFVHDRLFSLENGLWTADNILQAFENSDLIKIINRTSNSGMFTRGIDKDGKRIIAGSPSFHALSLLSNYSGNYYHKTTVNSPVFSVEDEKLKWAEYDMPWLRAAATSKNDSMYIAMINKHHSKKCRVSNNLDFKDNSKIVRYELTSDNFTDINTPDEPYKIYPAKQIITSEDEWILNEHSFYIYAFALADISKGSNINPDSSTIAYPNPTDRFLTIDNLTIQNTVINVYNLSGKLVKSVKTNGQDKVILDLIELDKGAYFIKTEVSNRNTFKIYLLK